MALATELFSIKPPVVANTIRAGALWGTITTYPVAALFALEAAFAINPLKIRLVGAQLPTGSFFRWHDLPGELELADDDQPK